MVCPGPIVVSCQDPFGYIALARVGTLAEEYQMRDLRFVLAIVASAALAACAQGTSDGITGSHPDAHVGGTPDTNFQSGPDANFQQGPDAWVPPPADAWVQPTPDAPISSGVCTSSSQCTDPQNPCCLDISGTGQGICFPDPGIPICL
jgi:hypothetical protein